VRYTMPDATAYLVCVAVEEREGGRERVCCAARRKTCVSGVLPGFRGTLRFALEPVIALPRGSLFFHCCARDIDRSINCNPSIPPATPIAHTNTSPPRRQERATSRVLASVVFTRSVLYFVRVSFVVIRCVSLARSSCSPSLDQMAGKGATRSRRIGGASEMDLTVSESSIHPPIDRSIHTTNAFTRVLLVAIPSSY